MLEWHWWTLWYATVKSRSVRSRRQDLRVGTSRGAFASVGATTGVFLSTHMVIFLSFLNRPSGIVIVYFLGGAIFVSEPRN